jgi:cytochrome c554/c'-like protein
VAVVRAIVTAGLVLLASFYSAGRARGQAFPTTPRTPENPSASRQNYVGDAVCGACHQDKLQTYSKTAHHLTSRPATAETIAGSFQPGQNGLTTSNPGLSFRMDAKGARFFESAIWGIPPATTTQSEPIDLVIGSGRKGQTYLYWNRDRLFQLPVSYWVELGHWVNSPGYADGYADFTRPVMPRCLECHASYAQSLPGPAPENHYNQSSLVLGISCERCHGPGREHVAGRHSSEKISDEAIVNPAKLPRDRDVEVCAQCHAGMRYPIAAAFTYIPGEPLDKYLDPDRADPTARIDVHGGQVALLQRSRCYQASGTMTCSTCHDVHRPQRDAAAFSSRCLSCHQVKDCRMYAKLGSKISNGCVDCHMPVQESKAIATDSHGQRIQARVRTHWIKVYPNANISPAGI